MGNVIVLQQYDKVEVWGSLTRICKCPTHKEFDYNEIKRLDYPFEYKGWRFVKVKYQK